MKRRNAARLAALCLTLVLVLSMAPVALAANASGAIASANRQNNFDYAYGTPALVDAGAEGAAFTKTFARPAGAESGPLYAAVEPVNASGSSLGQETRYVRLSDGGVLTYFRTGCRYFAVQLVQPVPDAGDGALYVQKDGEELDCLATLEMSRDMARLVDLYQTRDEMEEIEFTCHVRYNTDLLQVDTDTMELDSQVFQVVRKSQSRDGYGYDIACELRSDWDETRTGQTLVQKLMEEMTFTAKATLTAEDEEALIADGVTKLYASGWITVSDVPSPVLKSTSFQVPMVTTVLTLANTVADPERTGVARYLETGDHIAFMNGYPDGSFGPNLPIKRAEVAQMFYNLLLNKDVEITVSFDDVPGDKWYAAAVNTLASMGILTGDGKGGFAPERSITRAEFATIAARFGYATQGGAEFSDVPQSHWAYSYIMTASTYGWVTGVGDGRFEPQRNITRAEAATLVNRMLGRSPDVDALAAGAGRSFTDVTKAHWAWAQIGEAATTHGYTKENGVEQWEA